ncbi:MAG: DMT family transporter [Pseudomonadota bacterium]
MSPLRQPTPYDIARLFFVGAVWGGSFIFIALALKGFGPISIAAWRIATAAAVLVVAGVLMKQSFSASPGEWSIISAVGLLNSAVPFFLINWGQQFISSAEAALLLATATFVALLISHFTSQDERITWARGIGVTVGFSGVAVLVLSELISTGIGGFKGQLAVILAGCSYATSSVLARRITHLPSISTSASTMITASAYMVPLAFLFEQPLSAIDQWVPVMSVVYLGVIGTALAFVIRFNIIRTNGAVFMAQVGYLVPFFGVIWSWLFLAEAISWQTAVSLKLILIGIAITRRARH